MKLVDLEPRWLESNGQRVAIMFRCPCSACVGKADIWLTCFFVAAGTLPRVPNEYPIESLRGWRGERALFYEQLKAVGHPDPVEGAFHDVVDCRADYAWNMIGEDFATMSVTPSIDASASGHWHGFITNGEIR